MKCHPSALALALALTLAVGTVAGSGCGGDGGDHAAPLTTSHTRLEKLSKAMLAYAADFDQTLPQRNWMDATESYANDPTAYKSPMVDGEQFGYAFNQDLVGKRLSAIQNRAATALIFDSTSLMRNAVASVDAIPVPGRYDGTNTIAFADGTVKDVPVKDAFVEASTRLKMLGVALLAYSADNDEHLPPATKWTDALQPYVQDPEAFHDGSLKPEEFGFAFNIEVSGKQVTALGPLGTTPILFSSKVVTKNAAAKVDSLPVPGRYAGRNAIYYLDGHVTSQLESPIEPENHRAVTLSSKP